MLGLSHREFCNFSFSDLQKKCKKSREVVKYKRKRFVSSCGKCLGDFHADCFDHSRLSLVSSVEFVFSFFADRQWSIEVTDRESWGMMSWTRWVDRVRHTCLWSNCEKKTVSKYPKRCSLWWCWQESCLSRTTGAVIWSWRWERPWKKMFFLENSLGCGWARRWEGDRRNEHQRMNHRGKEGMFAWKQRKKTLDVRLSRDFTKEMQLGLQAASFWLDCKRRNTHQGQSPLFRRFFQFSSYRKGESRACSSLSSSPFGKRGDRLRVFSLIPLNVFEAELSSSSSSQISPFLLSVKWSCYNLLSSPRLISFSSLLCLLSSSWVTLFLFYSKFKTHFVRRRIARGTESSKVRLVRYVRQTDLVLVLSVLSSLSVAFCFLPRDGRARLFRFNRFDSFSLVHCSFLSDHDPLSPFVLVLFISIL